MGKNKNKMISRLTAQSVRLAAMVTCGLMAGSSWAAIPNAVWNGDFPSSQTSLNGVTIYPTAGYSTSSDGIITLNQGTGGRTGAAFALPTGDNNFVSVVFTVDFSDVTLAENQILFSFGNSSKNIWVGAKLKKDGDTFYASGLWGGTTDGAEWTTVDDKTNAIDFTGEQTFLVTYDYLDGSSTKGTHLYVLDEGEAKVVYGKSDANGLKSGSVTKFAIGCAYGDVTDASAYRMSKLKIKACAIYCSSSSLPLTASDLPSYVYPTKHVVASGETLSISTLNNSAPSVAYIDSGATVNIDATPVANAMFGSTAFSMSTDNIVTSSDVSVNLKSGGKVRLPYTDVSTALTSIEDGASLVLTGDTANTGTLSVTLPTGANGANINATIIRKDGGYCTGTWNGTDAYTYNSTINTAICGSSTVFDWTFTNTFNYAYAASGIGNNNDGGESARAWNNTLADKSTGLMLTTRPYTSGNFLSSAVSAAMTLVVVGQMPSADNTFYLSLGHTNAKGIFLATTPTKNEVLVAWNNGSTVNAITTMTVPNASTTRHVYAITKEDTTIDSVAKSVFTVYLDGDKWKSITVDKIDITSGGVQCGADFGGGIRNKDSNVGGKTIKFVPVASGDTGYLNNIRFFNSVLDQATIKGFSTDDEYPYTSPYGESERMFTADSDWISTGAWTVTPNGGVATTAAQPLDGSSLTVVSDNDDGTTVSVNLASDTTYEKLSLSGDPIKFQFADGYSGIIKATGAISIDTATTIKDGALSVSGAITMQSNGSLIFDYADYDASGVTVANPQTTPLVLASMDEQEEGKVTCTLPTTPHRTYSFGYANGGYNLAITAQQATLNGTDVATFASALDQAVANDTVGINEDVTVADLELDKDITLDLGANTFTVTGSITGEGTLTLTGTGTLKVPVGTTIPNLTSTGSAKIAVTGAVTGQTVDAEGNISNGATLFTVTSGSYANTVIGSDYGDIHYTLDGTTYTAGKTFWWNGSGSADTERVATAAKWATDAGKTQAAAFVPTLFDTAVFDKTGCSVKIDASMPYNICVKVNTAFYSNPSSASHTFVLGTNAVATAFVVTSGVTTKLSQTGNKNSNKYEIYCALLGVGRLQCAATNSSSKWSGVDFKGDTSGFFGIVDLSQTINDQYNRITVADATDNSNARWFISTNGTYTSASSGNYTPFMVSGTSSSSQTYKFGVLRGYASNNSSCGKYLAFELGENINEDSWLKGSWHSATAQYGATVKWMAESATFTNAVANAYEVQLLGGGNVYIEQDATTANRNIPSRINFTGNGGYLLFDDDNVSIGGSILAAVNTKTAGVGLNAATDEAITVTAGVLTSTDFKKKGAGKITLTGAFTDLGTVTVTEGQLVFEATEALTAYANGENTSVSVSGTTYTFFPAKVNATTAAGVSSGYETVAEAVTAAGVGGTITLLANDSSESIALLGGQTLLLNGFTLAATPTAPAAADGNTYRIDAVVENEETVGYTTTVTATSWTDSSGDHKWTTASNWSSGVVPTKDTAITFPAGDDPENLATYTVYLDSDNCVCASMVVNGVPTIYQDNMAINVTKKIFVYGDVTGSGTLKMHYAGLNNASGANKTVSANIEVLKPEANENADSWFEGSVFTFTGTVTIPGKMCSYSQHIFTGTVNVNGVELYGSEDQHITGGTVNVNSGKLQVGLSNKAKWIKASENAVFNLNGGLLNICRITAVGPYTLNFNGGTLGSYGEGSANGKIIGGDSADKATITVNVSANSTITNATDTAIAPALNDTSDNASPVITKTGVGKLTLSATPAATIGFALAGGSLVIPNAYEGSVSVAPTLVYTRDSGEANTTWTITGNAVASVYGVGYATLAEAITAAGSDKVITLYADITEAINLEADQQIKIAFNNYKLDTENSGAINPAAGQQVGWIVVDGVSTVISTSNTESTWTDVTNDHVWNNGTNWSTGFVPTSSTAVKIPEGDYTIYLRDSGDVARSLVVNGNATLRYSSDNWDKWPYLTVNGDITGSGSLTLYRAGIQANAMVNVSCDFIFDGPNTSKDTFVSGNSQSGSGWNFTKSVTFSAGALSKVESLEKMPGGVTFNCPLTIGSGAAYTCVSDIAILGTTTLNGNFTKQGNGRLTLGDVTVAAASSITKSGGSMTFGGATTVSGDYALTLPSGLTIGEDASFVLGSSGATIVSSVDISGKVSSGVTGYAVSYDGTSKYSLVLDYVPVDDSTGTITVTGDSIKLAFNNVSGSATLSCTSGQPTVTVYATDGTGAKTSTNISGAFTVTSNGDGTYTVALDGAKTVDGVSVAPAVDTTAEKPFDVSTDTVGLTMKTIPGLWYGMAASDTPNGTYSVQNGENAVKQATRSTLTLSADLDSEAAVKFYRVKAGASKAALDAAKSAND